MGGDAVKFSRKLPISVILRAPGLLDMLYRPNELAEELRVPSHTVRDWLTTGIPCQRDAQGHVWINGREFARWVEEKRTKRPHLRLGEDEALCLHCHRRVSLLNPERSAKAGVTLLSGTCPHCGGTVHRGIRDDLPR